MALCHITGTVQLPDGSVAAGRMIQFKRAPESVVAQSGHGIIPDTTPVKVSQSGTVDFKLYTGNYIGIVRNQRGGNDVYFKFPVPEAASALFQDILQAVDPVEPLPSWLTEVFEARDDALLAEMAAQEAADRAAANAALVKPQFDSVAQLQADTAMNDATVPVGGTVSVNGVGGYVRVASGGDIVTAGGLDFYPTQGAELVSSTVSLPVSADRSSTVKLAADIADSTKTNVLIGSVDQSESYASETVIVQPRINARGVGRNTQIRVDGDFDGDTLFKLNVDEDDHFIVEFVQPPNTEFSQMVLNASDARTDGRDVTAILFAGGMHFHDLDILNFGWGIKQLETHFSDLVTIERCHFYQNTENGGYHIELNGSGDGVFINQVNCFQDYGSSVYSAPREKLLQMRERLGGSVTNLINGDVDIKDCSGLTMSGWHMERGLTTITNTDGSLSNSHIYMRELSNLKGVPITFIQPPVTSTYRGSVFKLSNITFNYNNSLPGGIPNDGINNFALEFPGSPYYNGLLSVELLHRSDGGDTGNSINRVSFGVSCGMSDFDNYSHITSIKSDMANGSWIFDAKLPAITNSLILDSGQSDLINFHKWQIPSGTYHYRAVSYLDKVRKVGRTGSTVISLSPTLGGNAPSLVIANSARQQTIIRLYRGLSSGAYTHYVDVPLLAGGRLVDNGLSIGGYPWIARTSGDIDTVNTNIDAGLKISAGVFDTASDAYGLVEAYSRSSSTPPTVGGWRKGDKVLMQSPAISAGKVLLGWIRLTDCTSSAPTHVMGTDWSPMYVSTT